MNQKLPPPFSVEHLCEFPANLARTEVVVRPCVALLHSYDPGLGLNADPEVSLIPILDASEVEAVFTAPFKAFLSDSAQNGHEWYRGSWGMWHNSQWRSKSIFIFFLSFLFFFFYGVLRRRWPYGIIPCRGWIHGMFNLVFFSFVFAFISYFLFLSLCLNR